MVILALIGVASVVHRAIFLKSVFSASHLPPSSPTDVGFAAHPWLTLAHISPGLLFMILGPLQFVRGIRQRRPALHRWIGRILLVCGVVIGLSALVMGFRMPIGGALETAAIAMFGSLFLFALWRGYQHVLRRDFVRHREWMIRAFAVGLAVATTRPIVGIFFATSPLTHLTPHEFFGIAFWIGFTLQTAAAEIYIRRGKTSRADVVPVGMLARSSL